MNLSKKFSHTIIKTNLKHNTLGMKSTDFVDPRLCLEILFPLMPSAVLIRGLRHATTTTECVHSYSAFRRRLTGVMHTDQLWKALAVAEARFVSVENVLKNS